MSRSARTCAAVGAVLLVAGAAPAGTSAHALGETFQLPVPLWLYLVGAGLAVAASFVVTAAISRAGVAGYSTRPVSRGLAAAARWALRFIGLAWWYGAIVVGFVVGDISPLPAVLLWIGIWVGLPIVAVLLGNPWPSLSPFRTTFAALEWVARRAGMISLDAGVPYPPGLARWPAVALLATGIWAELILPGAEVATTVAVLMLAYTVLTLVGMALFGQIGWLRNAELFEVELGWFGRLGPLTRRSVTPQLCDGCGDRCDPNRCLDCPECSVAADDRERRPELRPWIAGLADVQRAGWSDAVFVVLLLAGVTFDGLAETAAGASLLEVWLTPLLDLLGPTNLAFQLAAHLHFATVLAVFLLAFTAVVWLTHRLAPTGPGSDRPLSVTVGAYAATLLPIAAGYVIAHYLTLVIQGAVWLPSLVADPLMSLAPDVGWIPISAVWYLSVGAIVGGHVAAIVLAHRIALRHAPARPALVGLPMVGLMIGYTVLSLWIIAQPIVVEPGATPPTAVGTD